MEVFQGSKNGVPMKGLRETVSVSQNLWDDLCVQVNIVYIGHSLVKETRTMGMGPREGYKDRKLEVLAKDITCLEWDKLLSK